MPKNLVTIEGLHTGGIRALAGTYKGEDGPVLLTGGEDRNLNISRALTGEFIRKVPAFTGRPGHPGHRDKIYAIAIWTYKLSSYIVSTGEDKLLRVFALSDLEAIRTMPGHTDFIHTLVVVDSIAQAVSASYDRTTRIWDLHSGDELQQFRQPKVLFAMDYCIKSLTHFATGNASYIHVWNSEDWRPDNRSQITRELRSHTRTVTALAYPKMDLLVSGSDDAHICVWNPQVPDCPLLQKLGSQSPVYNMKWYDDGCAFLLVTAHWGKPYVVRIWSLEPKEKEKDLAESSDEDLDSDEEAPPKVMLYCYPIDKGEAHTAPVLNLAILDDGMPHIVVEKRKSDADIDTKMIASLSQDGTIRTWDLRPAIETMHRKRFLAGAQTSRMV